MTKTADITVLIVAFRSRGTIMRCLNALEQQSVRPRKVCLLENGSPAEEQVDVDQLPDWVSFTRSDTNLGFAAGNNLLAKQVEGEWLVLLNPDAFPRVDWIEELEKATQRYKSTKLFGSTQLVADRADLLDGAGDVYHAAGLAYRAAYGRSIAYLPEEGEVFGPCGAGALISTKLFAALQGFDESLFCYNEDVDFAFRSRLLGERAIQLRSAVIEHVGYGSSGRRSDFAIYYGVRNRMWVFVKNMPGYLFWLLLPVHLFATMCLWVAAISKGQGAVFTRAILDAVSGIGKIWKSRRAVQSNRVVPASDIANAMCWNSKMLLTRAPDIRPIGADDGEADQSQS